MDKRYLKSAAVERTIGRRLGRLKGLLSIRGRRDTTGSTSHWLPIPDGSCVHGSGGHGGAGCAITCSGEHASGHSTALCVSGGVGSGRGPRHLRPGALSDRERQRLKEFWKQLPPEDKRLHLGLTCQQVSHGFRAETLLLLLLRLQLLFLATSCLHRTCVTYVCPVRLFLCWFGFGVPGVRIGSTVCTVVNLSATPPRDPEQR